MMMRYGKNFTGNERFYGFCVDVLELVARYVGFDYILDLVPDRKYGAKNSQTGEWNGMVAQLMKYVSKEFNEIVKSKFFILWSECSCAILD